MSKAEEGYGSIPSEEDAPAPAAEPSLVTQLIAEVFGTCTLVQVGCGGLCVGSYMYALSGVWQAAVIWAFGGTLAIYAIGRLSGGHINPAVTLAFAIVRPSDFPWSKVLLYWCAQLVGGILAGILNLLIFHKAIKNFEDDRDITRGGADGIKSAVAFGDYYSLKYGAGGAWHATFIEGFGTAFLCFFVFACTNSKNNVPSFAVPPIVGFSIGMMIALLGTITGAGINPARDLGPRLVTLVAGWGSASMTDVWPYMVGPLIGGPIGAALADFGVYMLA